ncbi:MAG: pantoate--beta-alanine ligase [Armatimonadota bacterium]|nr:pantoate--beta-alanine ligase [Armatimonadota bacterium]
MQIVHTIAEIRKLVGPARAEGKLVGLVPTMGAFHAGHLALMSRARHECGFVVVSIFVNPAQFGPSEDYQKYPRDQKSDAEKAEVEGVDVIFAPSVEEMYPEGFGSYIEVVGLTETLEGAVRPGHFRGVAIVVAKLFNIVAPDNAYFGMKDYQQLKVIQKMVRDLDFDLEIIPVPTIRESDGLAMSSRNVYLDTKERAAATILYRALEFAKERVLEGERYPAALEAAIRRFIEQEPLAKIDYVAVVDPDTLEKLEKIGASVLVALAVKIGKTRLIDNNVIFGFKEGAFKTPIPL